MKRYLLALLTILAVTNFSKAQCDASFTYTHIDCDSVWFVPASTGSQYVYFWDFGDGNTSMSQQPTNTYASNGSFVVILTIQDTVANCFQSQTQVVNINCSTSCSIFSLFTYNMNPSNCEVLFVGTATGGTPPYSYFWDFGDGNTATGPNPTHQYPNNSTWTPCLTVVDAAGCDTTYCDFVTVSCTPPPCDAQFTYTYAACDSVIFFPVSVGSQYTYSWDFGDGNTSNDPNPGHWYTADGSYAVVLTLTDTVAGCTDIITGLVTVSCGTPCTVNGAIAHNVDSSNCTVQFVSTAFGGTPPYTYFWNFGDGNTSTDPSPAHNYVNMGAWTPCLTITDATGCDTVICDVVFVNCVTPSCDANFSPTYLSCSDVIFNPVNTGPQYTHFWDYGDGNTSTDPTPTHTFADGVYIVWHYVEDTLTGCADSTLLTITIACGTGCTVDGVWTYNLNTSNCEVHFASSAWGGQAPYTYFWNFGDGNTSTLANPIHQYPNNSTWTPCLTITDMNGCDTTICYPITVSCTSVNCDATFTQTYVGCDSIWFIPAVQDSSISYWWDFGDGNTSSQISPVHHFGANGTYTVVLYITDSLTMCTNAYTSVVSVNCGASPCNMNAVTTWTMDSTDCSVLMISSVWGGTAPYTYYWTFGDGNTSSDPHPTHTYPGPGAWTPCLTVTDAVGCDTTICMVVTPNCMMSVEETNVFELAVYPNPSEGVYNILLPNDSELMVYDLTGKLIISDYSSGLDGMYNLDLSDQENGMYILLVKLNDQIVTKKLVKR